MVLPFMIIPLVNKSVASFRKFEGKITVIAFNFPRFRWIVHLNIVVCAACSRGKQFWTATIDSKNSLSSNLPLNSFGIGKTKRTMIGTEAAKFAVASLTL